MVMAGAPGQANTVHRDAVQRKRPRMGDAGMAGTRHDTRLALPEAVREGTTLGPGAAAP